MSTLKIVSVHCIYLTLIDTVSAGRSVARLMHPGDDEAPGGGVLGGVIDGTRTHMAVHSLVHGHNISRVVLISLYPFLDVAALRGAPVIVPANIINTFLLVHS